MKILAFAAALRRDSFNRKLIKIAADAARRAGAEVDLAEFRDFDMPLYDGDVEEAGFPPGALALKARLDACQGFIIASPEYNFSLPGTLKNAIDWASRTKPNPWARKTGLLIATSTGFAGGIRGLWQLRIPLEANNAIVWPDMFALPNAASAFGEDGAIKDPAIASRLEKLIKTYLEFTGKL